MRRQLDSTSEDLSESSRSKDIALRENRRLQDDLAVMTRENQKLNSELQETLEDREQLKHQVQDYIMEVKRIEDVLARKVSSTTVNTLVFLLLTILIWASNNFCLEMFKFTIITYLVNTVFWIARFEFMHFAKQNFVSLFKEIFISIQFFAFHTDIQWTLIMHWLWV